LKNIVVFFILISLLSGCERKSDSSASPSRPPSAQEINLEDNYIQQGVAFLNKSDLPAAIHSFNKAIAQNPQDPKPRMILAEVYIRIKNYEGAVNNLNSVVALQPDNAAAYYFLGICKGLMGDRKTAIENVQRAVAIFQQKKDEENFKKALLTLQQMMQAQEATQ